MPGCPFNGWCVVELMGHVRTGAKVSGAEWGGVAFLRLDITTVDGVTTQFVAPNAVYRITPTTEEVARAVAAANEVRPVSRWELPAPRVAEEAPASEPTYGLDPDEDDRDDFDGDPNREDDF